MALSGVLALACVEAQIGDQPGVAGATDRPESGADAEPDGEAPVGGTPGSGFELALIGRHEMSSAADLALDPARNLVAVSGLDNGDVLLLDVSDRSQPALRGRIAEIGYNADVQIKGNLLYVTRESVRGPVSRGIEIYDIADPARPRLLERVGLTAGSPALQNCHNVFAQPDRELLYCASTTSGQLVVLSTGERGIGEPDDPRVLSTIAPPPGGRTHDMYAAGDRLYAAFLGQGLAVYDIADPLRPQLLLRQQYEGNFTHDVWPSADGSHLFTTDEQPGGQLRIWDIRDPGAVRQVGSYAPNPAAIMHNVKVIGSRAYISHYTDGVRVIDVGDPAAPVELAAYDLHPGADGGAIEDLLHGAWGIEVAPPHLFVSAIETGLWIFELRPIAP